MLQPDLHSQARHKESPQPNTFPTGILGQVNQVVTVLNDTQAVMLCICRLPNSGGLASPILKKISTQININNSSLSSTIPQELHPSFSIVFFPYLQHLQAFHYLITFLAPISHLITHFPICSAVCASCD